jgi:CBS domain-containing protein
VVEDDMTLVGIISEQDVLRLFHTYDDEKDRTVNHFMTQPDIHFDMDDPLSHQKLKISFIHNAITHCGGGNTTSLCLGSVRVSFVTWLCRHRVL